MALGSCNRISLQLHLYIYTCQTKPHPLGHTYLHVTYHVTFSIIFPLFTESLKITIHQLLSKWVGIPYLCAPTITCCVKLSCPLVEKVQRLAVPGSSFYHLFIQPNMIDWMIATYMYLLKSNSYYTRLRYSSHASCSKQVGGARFFKLWWALIRNASKKTMANIGSLFKKTKKSVLRHSSNML